MAQRVLDLFIPFARREAHLDPDRYERGPYAVYFCEYERQDGWVRTGLAPNQEAYERHAEAILGHVRVIERRTMLQVAEFVDGVRVAE